MILEGPWWWLKALLALALIGCFFWKATEKSRKQGKLAWFQKIGDAVIAGLGRLVGWIKGLLKKE